MLKNFRSAFIPFSHFIPVCISNFKFVVHKISRAISGFPAMSDYPEALGDAVANRAPREVGEYLKLVTKGRNTHLRTLETETELYGKSFNDPLHGHFDVHPLLVMIIDTPEFQRLRGIKALGCTFLVYPGATHTRFEHCIGVSHLAGRLIKALKERQPELQISRSEILCVQIAGLLHDLGHGPFSHMWEKVVNLVNPGAHWEHEEMSIKMFHHLLDTNKELRPAFTVFGLQEEDIKFIGELIMGWKRSTATRPNSKRFLYDIVANKRSGVDVDKWDYLSRDSRQVGMKNQFDCERFIKFSRVLWTDELENGEKVMYTQIGFRDKEIENIYDMFNLRVKMHKRVYQHHVVRILDAMICEAIKAANDHMWITGNKGQCHPAVAYGDVSAYRKLNDNILEDIYNDDVRPEMAAARALIHRIKTRKLYTLLGRTQPSEMFADPEETVRAQIIQTATTLHEALTIPPVTAAALMTNLLVIKSCYSYGMGADNPNELVAFYGKDDADTARFVSRTEVSTLLPTKYQECEILICYRSEDQDEIAAAREVIQAWARRKKILLNKSSVKMTTTKRKRDDQGSDEEPLGSPKSVRKQDASKNLRL
ncbi:Deoxynucleoside triphosphate triphosphohydrolase SAMHD1 [Hypsibius exemplaris]|uniref:Deoxynucleoside triphosphate triphosphohydrolase SAMHD1 n=1 Tax=Hypsibius exemplaris TaxID=2072580 RepID=A0A1W0WZ29_HYPEX|nr:Deoxynucleoside triphosphate triphosphohydrolase SAMHD1 [Hypsibius exemplaris]